eukprot:10126990-Karenia_brevis.AAC.1
MALNRKMPKKERTPLVDDSRALLVRHITKAKKIQADLGNMINYSTNRDGNDACGRDVRELLEEAAGAQN